mmetsp:Transcript_26414/g.88494  ORF Transcript_26414/g.88494 Transcript_26414/m.88494 type:complete len:280 (-) Transcript_26414:13-852(-)
MHGPVQLHEGGRHLGLGDLHPLRVHAVQRRRAVLRDPRVRHDLRHRYSPLRVLLQHVADQGRGPGAHGGVRDDDAVEADARYERVKGLRLKWQAAEEELVEGDAQGPHVRCAARVDPRRAAEHLGGRVGRRPLGAHRGVAVKAQQRDAKVADQVHAAPVVVEDVVGLDVPVYHVLVVQVLEASQHVAHAAPRLGLGQRGAQLGRGRRLCGRGGRRHDVAGRRRALVAYARDHGPAPDVLEHEVHLVIGRVVDDLVQAHDVGVAELLHDGHLTEHGLVRV